MKPKLTFGIWLSVYMFYAVPAIFFRPKGREENWRWMTIPPPA